MHGYGVFHYYNGDFERGIWKEDNFIEGNVKKTYSDEYYEGEFKNEEFNGKGKYYFNNGNYFEGKYRFDKIIGDGEEKINGVIYKGYYYNGLNEGKFTVIKDGQVDYIEFRNGEEKSKCIIY